METNKALVLILNPDLQSRVPSRLPPLKATYPVLSYPSSVKTMLLVIADYWGVPRELIIVLITWKVLFLCHILVYISSWGLAGQSTLGFLKCQLSVWLLPQSKGGGFIYSEIFQWMAPNYFMGLDCHFIFYFTNNKAILFEYRIDIQRLFWMPYF